MRKRDYERLLRQAAVAYNLNSDDYTQIMDRATIEVEDWDKFCADLDEAIKIPPTDREMAKHARKEMKKAIEAAKRNLKSAERRLRDLTGE